MNYSDKKIYSEVYSILQLLGQEYIRKLPEKLINHIKKNRLLSYNPFYTLEKDLAKQDIQKESIALIALMNYKYWAKDNKEKKEIYSLIKMENSEDY